MSAETNRIDAMFARKREAGERAIIFFVTAGFPDAQSTEEVIAALDEAGADLIELGIPFSDPIADGPTIQHSSKVALDGGMSVKGVLEIARRARGRSSIPLLFFSAFNPILHYGVERFLDAARDSGGDGLLLPDLPPEEARETMTQCAERGLKLVFLAAPTSDAERRRLIAQSSTGFIYYISLRGVTGAREDVAPDLREKIEAIKAITSTPVAVGFGISKPKHVRMAAEAADGIVIGSALIDLIKRHAGTPRLRGEVVQYARSLIEALPTRATPAPSA